MIHEELIIVTHEDRLPPLVELDFPAELEQRVLFRVPNKRLILSGTVKEISLEDKTLRVQYTRPQCGQMDGWISVDDLLEDDEAYEVVDVEFCPCCGQPMHIGRHQIRRAADDFFCDTDDYDGLVDTFNLCVQAGRLVR